ncbi:hypothetical protein NDU88_000657 [Pleurodeles waltl]|uniref:Uncharacterized protein n=1 Tax=Pleurodeles waltl TaxID=8319 RepID=A0AAV7P1G8_PLEWA|nr:hypothetical protein NDU88_000657 [Pleurodeles waltl]
MYLRASERSLSEVLEQPSEVTPCMSAAAGPGAVLEAVASVPWEETRPLAGAVLGPGAVPRTVAVPSKETQPLAGAVLGSRGVPRMVAVPSEESRPLAGAVQGPRAVPRSASVPSEETRRLFAAIEEHQTPTDEPGAAPDTAARGWRTVVRFLLQLLKSFKDRWWLFTTALVIFVILVITVVVPLKIQHHRNAGTLLNTPKPSPSAIYKVLKMVKIVESVVSAPGV